MVQGVLRCRKACSSEPPDAEEDPGGARTRRPRVPRPCVMLNDEEALRFASDDLWKNRPFIWRSSKVLSPKHTRGLSCIPAVAVPSLVRPEVQRGRVPACF